MAFPTDVGIIDLMLDIPTGDQSDWYEFLKPQLREESRDFEFPVQYMFHDVPHVDGGPDPVGAQGCSGYVTVENGKFVPQFKTTPEKPFICFSVNPYPTALTNPPPNVSSTRTAPARSNFIESAFCPDRRAGFMNNDPSIFQSVFREFV